MVHAEIHRVDGIAAVERGGRHADDRLARAHLADAVDHQQAHQIEASERAVGKLVHARQGQRLVMGELQRLDPVIEAHFADKGAHPAQPRIGLRERPDQRAGDKHLGQQADIAHRHGQPPETGGSSAISSPSFATRNVLSANTSPLSATLTR